MTTKRLRDVTFTMMLLSATAAFSSQPAQATMMMSVAWTDCIGWPWNQDGCESNAVGMTGCVGEASSGLCMDALLFCQSECGAEINVEHFSCGPEPVDPGPVGFVCRCIGCEIVE